MAVVASVSAACRAELTTVCAVWRPDAAPSTAVATMGGTSFDEALLHSLVLLYRELLWGILVADQSETQELLFRSSWMQNSCCCTCTVQLNTFQRSRLNVLVYSM